MMRLIQIGPTVAIVQTLEDISHSKTFCILKRGIFFCDLGFRHKPLIRDASQDKPLLSKHLGDIDRRCSRVRRGGVNIFKNALSKHDAYEGYVNERTRTVYV